MAIRGGLTEFSVPELLQLLSLQQKTGMLTLTHRQGQTHTLFFHRGRVLAGADRRQNSRHEFLAYLYQNQHLTQDQVESVEDICRSTNHDLFTVLLTSGVMSRDRLGEEMHRHAQRVVDELTSWKEGKYDFVTGDEKSLPAQGLRLTLNPEELVLESMRRNDELVTMKESMLAPDLILAQVEDAPSQPVPRECVVVLRLVDGERTIEEISRLAPMGEFLTYDAIAELLGRQLIMIVDPHDAVRRSRKKVKRSPTSLSAMTAFLLLILGSAILGSGLGPILSRSRGDADWLPASAMERRGEVRAIVSAQARELIPSARSAPEQTP
jgi:hypothetical protein